MEQHYLSRRVSMDTFNRNYYQSDVMTPEEAQRSQKPYRYGMILLCFGALINWIGLAENYTDPFRYAGVACIIGGALLICTAMCCWLHVPNRSAVGASETDDDPIHVISVADQPTTEKPPEYDSVVLEPPCYDDAIKLNPANLLQTKCYQDVTLPNYNDLRITTNSNDNNNTNNSNSNGNSHSLNTTTNDNNSTNNNSNSNSNSGTMNPYTAITIEQSSSDTLDSRNSIISKLPDDKDDNTTSNQHQQQQQQNSLR